jgi:hypothetical protein
MKMNKILVLMAAAGLAILAVASAKIMAAPPSGPINPQCRTPGETPPLCTPPALPPG